MKFKSEGDASLWKNRTNYAELNYMIEFATAPNNPDGQLNQAVLHGPNAKAIMILPIIGLILHQFLPQQIMKFLFLHSLRSLVMPALDLGNNTSPSSPSLPLA